MDLSAFAFSRFIKKSIFKSVELLFKLIDDRMNGAFSHNHRFIIRLSVDLNDTIVDCGLDAIR
jgi:hypothetical protein